MRLCSVEDCDRPHWARSYCQTHYGRFKRNGHVELLGRGGAQCLAAECSSPNYSNGLCVKHYQRLRQTGRLEHVTVVERLVAGYEVDERGCWVWTGAPGKNGYGRISVGNTVLYAHRVSYETFIGPIPDGLSIDHLCRVRTCINPAHLEPVTLAENTRREMAARRSS